MGLGPWSKWMAAVTLLGSLAACGGLDALSVPAPDDAGQTFLPPAAPDTHRIREDFNNQLLIESATGAVVDVNQGVVTLPVQSFPVIDGDGEDNYRTRVERNGLIEADTIRIEDAGTLLASDSIELRARERVEVSGQIQAGLGGVTIIAGDAIVIDGTITSKGPVRLMVGSASGSISVLGSITTRTDGDVDEVPPTITLLGRGNVSIRGQVITTAESGLSAGDINFNVYGDLDVTGANARVTTGGVIGAIQGGVILLKSESRVTISQGAQVGARAPYADPSNLVIGNHVEIQGASILVGDASRIIAGSTPERGGYVILTAETGIVAAPGSQITGGAGPVGGQVSLRAATVQLSGESLLVGGHGIAGAGGRVSLEAVARVELSPNARAEGGGSECGPGGAVDVMVAGSIVLERGARLVGGDGSVAFGAGGSQCSHPASGGNVTVLAAEARGLDGALVAGKGEPEGMIVVRLETSPSVPLPNLSTRTGGQIISRPIDRGDDAIGARPRFVEMLARVPQSTWIRVELCGSVEQEGPYDEWIVVDANPALLEPLRHDRWFRYRVTLGGRAFDAPILDLFEIELAPR